MTEVVEVVADRLASLIPSRTVYRHGVPRGALPSRYLLVTGSTGQTLTENLAMLPDSREPTFRIVSVSRNEDPEVAGREALWGAEVASDAVMGWRPTLSPGLSTGRPEHVTTAGLLREDDLPDVVMSTSDLYLIHYQP